jgi:hypothetical protein
MRIDFARRTQTGGETPTSRTTSKHTQKCTKKNKKKQGNITLSFSYPVVLSQLQAALKLVACCNSTAGSGRTLSVMPCPAPAWTPFVFSYSASRLADPSATTPALAAQNATCAVVRISPALPVNEGAILRLPKGARYGPLSGPLSGAADQDVYVWGLRRFRIPLRQDFVQYANASQAGGGKEVGYRRLGMWLPHGLAAGVVDAAASLLPLIALCRYADPYRWESPCLELDRRAWNLTRPKRGQLVLSVPQLAPRQHYRMRVAGSGAVRDAYGLPLLSSEAFFFTGYVNGAFQGPQLATGSNFAIVETPLPGLPTAAALPWPWVSVGGGGGGGDATGSTRASFWPLGWSSSQTSLLVSIATGENTPLKALPAPAGTVQRASSANGTASVSSLQLSGAPGVQLVASCCSRTYAGDGGYNQSLADRLVVVSTDLQVAAAVGAPLVVVWVSTTQGAPAPVAGAKVTLYLKSWGTVRRRVLFLLVLLFCVCVSV